jgi:hypothetical protein
MKNESLRPKFYPESSTELQHAMAAYTQAMEMYMRGEYTHPRTIMYLPGGMAPAAAVANGIRHQMNMLGVTLPLFVGSSAPGMTLAPEQVGYPSLQTHRIMTDFSFSEVLNNPVSNLLNKGSLFSHSDYMRYYLRFGDYANKVQMNAHLESGRFEGKGFNLGFVSTKLNVSRSLQESYRESVLITSGKLITAVMASHAVPIMLPPMRYGEHRLIDGDLSHDLPMQQIEDFLGFKPEEVIKVNILAGKSKFISGVKHLLGRLTGTPGELADHEWSHGVPVKILNVEIPPEHRISPIGFSKREKMDAIFRISAQAAASFFTTG